MSEIEQAKAWLAKRSRSTRSDGQRGENESMSNNKASQAARTAADRRLREAHPEDFESFMNAEHEARGLTWNRRLTQQEREERQRADNERRALTKIQAIAAQNGLTKEALTSAIALLNGEPYEYEQAARESEAALQDEAAQAGSHAKVVIVRGKGGGVY